jgi:CelD/BcsL family acetyltransferase involved in cellulose biosynthesis
MISYSAKAGISDSNAGAIARAGTCEYRIYSDLQQIRELSCAWDQLLASSPCNKAFASLEWYAASCSKQDSWTPYAVVAYRGGNAVCILPLVLDHEDSTAKFPHHGADYNDVVAGSADGAMIADLLSRALSLQNGCKRMVLSRVRPDSGCADAFQFLQQRTDIDCAWRDIDSYWHIQLPASFDDYLKSRSPTLRKDVRKASRNLERQGLAIRELYPSELDPVDLPLLLTTLGVARHREKCSFIRAPYIQRFYNETLPPLFKKGFLRAFAILRRTQIVALDLCTVTAGGLATDNGGFLPEVEHCSPGTALFAFGIQQAIASGFQEFDFTRGDEIYKRRWANSSYIVGEIEATLAAS